MFIKLQPDQVTLFWDPIKHGMINTYKIPKDYQQDFALSSLKELLTGMSQCWIGFNVDEEGNKKIHFILITKIINEKYFGIKTLLIDTLYGFRLISEEMVSEIDKGCSEFAKANNCNAMAATYNSNRVKDFLTSQGFEDHRSTCRKFLS